MKNEVEIQSQLKADLYDVLEEFDGVNFTSLKNSIFSKIKLIHYNDHLFYPEAPHYYNLLSDIIWCYNDIQSNPTEVLKSLKEFGNSLVKLLND